MPERNNDLGQRLRQIRKNARLTQDDLGLLLGLSTRKISDYERGVSVPWADLVRAWLLLSDADDQEKEVVAMIPRRVKRLQKDGSYA